jgi:hypothetical protein
MKFRIRLPAAAGVILVLAVLTYWPVLLQGRLPGGELSDTTSQGYPFMLYVERSLEEGHLPLWNPYVFCGIPFYSSFSAPVFHPVRGLLMVLGGAEAFIRFTFPIHMVLAGIFAWLFLGTLGLGRWARLVGAVAYACGAWANTLFYAGHGSKVVCWSLLPLALYGCERWMRSGRVVFAAVAGLALGLQGLASHPQMMLYTGGAVLIWLAWRAGQRGGGRSWARAGSGLAAVALLGLAIGAVQLLPGYNFSTVSTRGGNLSPEMAASYSLPPEETLTMAFPRLFGLRHGFPDSSVAGVPVYFGRLGLRLSSEFLGVSVLALAVIGIILAGRRRRWPLLAIGLAGLLVSWGGYTPLFDVLYAVVPLFRKLRAPHMAAFLTTTGLSLMAAYGLHALRREGAPLAKVRSGLLIGSGACLLLLLAAGPVSEALQSGWWKRMGAPGGAGYGGVIGRRVSLARMDFAQAAAVLLAMAGLVEAHRREKLAGWGLPAALVALVALELVPFNRDFQVYLHRSDVESVVGSHEELAGMAGPGRVYPGSNDLVPDSILSVAGYHAAKPAVTEDLLSALSGGGPPALRQTAATVFRIQGSTLSYRQLRQALAADTSRRARDAVRRMPEEPLPRAFLADSYLVARPSDIERSLSVGYDPQAFTLLAEGPELPAGVSGRGTVRLMNETPVSLELAVESEGPGLLVLADTWDPRWRVRVDGLEADVLRANHWQRAVAVPGGNHRVVFRYDASDVRTGGIITALATLLVVAVAFVDRWRRGRAA